MLGKTNNDKFTNYLVDNDRKGIEVLYYLFKYWGMLNNRKININQNGSNAP